MPIFATPAAIAFGGVPVDCTIIVNSSNFMHDLNEKSHSHILKNTTYRLEYETPSNMKEQQETLSIMDVLSLRVPSQQGQAT